MQNNSNTNNLRSLLNDPISIGSPALNVNNNETYSASFRTPEQQAIDSQKQKLKHAMRASQDTRMTHSVISKKSQATRRTLLNY